MERFVIIVSGWKLLTVITNRSIVDVAAALDPPLVLVNTVYLISLNEENFRDQYIQLFR